MPLTFCDSGPLDLAGQSYLRFFGWTPFVTRQECRICRKALHKLARQEARSGTAPLSDKALFGDNAALIHQIANSLYDSTIFRDGKLIILERDIPSRADIAA